MTKEEIELALLNFIRKNGRYPDKEEFTTSNGFPSYNTCWRKLGQRKLWKYLEQVYDENPKLCLHCGNPIQFTKRTNKFCNQSCSAGYNNPRRLVTSNSVWKDREPNIRQERGTNCLFCGVKLPKGNAKYCSSEHRSTHKLSLKVDAFLDGVQFSSRVSKELLITINGYRCSCCGISDWNGKNITLELEHVDGDSGNNQIDNLKLLCPNCHSQTDTYKAKNIGKGRHSRMERYHSGKSY